MSDVVLFFGKFTHETTMIYRQSIFGSSLKCMESPSHLASHREMGSAPILSETTYGNAIPQRRTKLSNYNVKDGGGASPELGGVHKLIGLFSRGPERWTEADLKTSIRN